MQIGLTSQATPQSSCDNVALRNLRDDVMNSLKEKLREVSDPLAGSAVSLSNYLDPAGTATEARRALSYERNEPLPSRFKDRDFRSVRDGRVLAVAPPESDPVKAPNLFHYIAAALVLWSVCAAAAYFTAAIPLTGKGAVKPVTKADVGKAATPNHGVTATAAFLSAPPADNKGGWQTQLTPGSPAEPEAWSDTVETFKTLLAERKAMQAPEMKQTDAERVLGRLEAWSTAKPR
jgi:hypothetical protein